jgi:hypothetical protein
MWELFTISFVLLCGLVFIQAMVLQGIVRETASLKRRFDPSRDIAEDEQTKMLSERMPAPEFSAPLLQTGEFLSNNDLKGHPSILVFVSPVATSPAYKTLSAAVHAWYHDTDGHIYLVCTGSRHGCQQLASDACAGLPEGHSVSVILDEDARITRGYGIEHTPQAVKLDEMAQLVRYGHPDENDVEAHAEEAPTPALNIYSNTTAAEIGETSSPYGTVVSSDGETRCFWPDNRPDTGAAYARVDTSVSCVLTRFQLRSVWSLIPFYIAFRRVRRGARDISGFLHAGFLVENLHTCYTMSLWRDDCAILDFSTRVHAHVRAANSAFGPTYRSDLKRAEIWSAQFRLWAVSEHNLQWDGLDLETVLSEQRKHREGSHMRAPTSKENRDD